MVLEQEGTKMSLGIPFQQILNLTAFVDRCSDRNWQVSSLSALNVYMSKLLMYNNAYEIAVIE